MVQLLNSTLGRISVHILSGTGLLLCLCVVQMSATGENEVDPSWENIFRTRNDDDWREVWHTERHRRCYHDLLVHMDWVCDKDIYAVQSRKKRSLPSSWLTPYKPPSFLPSSTALSFLQKRGHRSDDDDDDEERHLSRIVGSEKDGENSPFLDVEQANTFFGRFAPTRRRRGSSHNLYKRGIIDECCHASAGCSWEEYAEYCPANSRVRSS